MKPFLTELRLTEFKTFREATLPLGRDDGTHRPQQQRKVERARRA